MALLTSDLNVSIQKASKAHAEEEAKAASRGARTRCITPFRFVFELPSAELRPDVLEYLEQVLEIMRVDSLAIVLNLSVQDD